MAEDMCLFHGCFYHAGPVDFRLILVCSMADSGECMAGPFAVVPPVLQRPAGNLVAPVRAGSGPPAVNYYSKLSLNSSRKRQPSIDNLRGLDVPS